MRVISTSSRAQSRRRQEIVADRDDISHQTLVPGPIFARNDNGLPNHGVLFENCLDFAKLMR